MARGDCFFRGAARTETDVRAGGSRVRLPRRARTWSFSRRLLKAASRGSGGGLDSASLWRGEGAWGVGAEGRGELGRGAPGSAGRGGVGFQSAGDSGRGLGAGSLPAEAAAQRRLCFLQEGRAAQRPFASAGLPRLSTFGAPQNPRDGAKVGPKSRCARPLRPLFTTSPSLSRPLLAGRTGSAGACCGCFGSPRFSPLSSGPAPQQVGDPA